MAELINASRRLSTSAVVQAITTYGPISRASVSKITELSKQTVSEIVASLEKNGWVQTVGQTAGNVGRRAVVYEIVPDAALVASVDLGGTKVRAALCDLTGAVVCDAVEPTDHRGGDAVVFQISRLILEAAQKRDIPPEKIRVAVVGVPGVPDPRTGAVNLAPNIPGIDSIDFPALLQSALGIEVLVENDVNLAALGEHWIGQQGEKDDLVFISVGTGIGAGVVVGGKLVRGASGAAGEIGYLPFGADPFDGESLRTGALERVSATNAISGSYAERGGGTKDVPAIFDAAAAGDAIAQDVLQCTAREIARAIASIAAVLDPACVVVGGSIGARSELIAMIRTAAAQCFPRPIAIEPSVLGNHAALAGGAHIALSRLHIALFASYGLLVPPPAAESYQRAAI